MWPAFLKFSGRRISVVDFFCWNFSRPRALELDKSSRDPHPNAHPVSSQGIVGYWHWGDALKFQWLLAFLIMGFVNRRGRFFGTFSKPSSKLKWPLKTKIWIWNFWKKAPLFKDKEPPPLNKPAHFCCSILFFWAIMIRPSFFFFTKCLLKLSFWGIIFPTLLKLDIFFSNLQVQNCIVSSWKKDTFGHEVVTSV